MKALRLLLLFMLISMALAYPHRAASSPHFDASRTPGPTRTRTPTRTPTALVSATASSTSVATATGTATSPTTDTPVGPTATLASSATPGGFIQPYLGAPQCPANIAYHGIWNYQLGCHYNHTHGDDPHILDDVFGVGAYAALGGDVGTRWPESPTAPQQGYKWVTGRDEACSTQYDGCIVTFRAQAHMFGATPPTTVQYHDGWLEAVVAPAGDPTNLGYIQVGGILDCGGLVIDGFPSLVVPYGFGQYKVHNNTLYNPHEGAWYCGSPGGEDHLGGVFEIWLLFDDMWGPVDNTAGAQTFFCPGDPANCGFNDSLIQPHYIEVHIPNRPAYRAAFDPDGDNIANYNGYFNRMGMPKTGCSTPGPDCVPVVISNVPFLQRFTLRGETKEYDIFFCGGAVCAPGSPGAVHSGWLTFPN